MIIGIDIGANGALAYRANNETVLIPMKGDQTNIVNALKIIIGISRHPEFRRVAYMEKLHGYPGMGAKSTFGLGRNAGIVTGALLTLGIPFIEIDPKVWQKALGISVVKRKSKDIKKESLIVAKRLFPELTVKTDGESDALLIMQYAVMCENGV